MTLKTLRKQKKLTQKDCALYLGVPLRTYQNYEKDACKESTLKYRYMLEKLMRYGYVDEETGILSLQTIRDACARVLSDTDVQYCYLFGSYAKGKATETSDVDLLLSSSASGMMFYDLVESLRAELKKKVDVLTPEQLKDNPGLISEILKDGIKVYG